MDLPGEKLVTRLWETVAEKGIGSLLRPWQIRREGEALAEVRRDEMLLLAQAERDSAEIREGRVRLLSSGELSASISTVPAPSPAALSAGSQQSIADVAAAAIAADAVRKEVNVARALLQAENELAGDRQDPPERKPDEDWLYRWRDAASTVSADELQHLWGRVLAGELKSPGSVSLRALEFLRNLSQQEASAIARLSPLAINDVIFRDDEALRLGGINFDFLLSMQDLGILLGVESFGIEKTLKAPEASTYRRILLGRDRALLVTHADVTKELKLPIYQLTPVGVQVLKLGIYETNLDYLRYVGKTLCEQGFDVALVRFAYADEASVRYFEPEVLCTPPPVDPAGTT